MKKKHFYFVQNKNKNGVGKHLIAEFCGCQEISAVKEMDKILKTAVKKMGATMVGIKIHRFFPRGITAIALIAESHISIHTWPEFEYAAVDIFTCGEKDPWPALRFLEKALGAKKVKVKERKRGKF